MTFDRSKALGLWLRRRAENVIVALLTLMFGAFVLQVFFRYVIGKPLGWSEEVIVTAWLWTILWGAAFVLSEVEEIRFDMVYSNVTEATRRLFTVLTGIALILAYGISLPASYRYVSFMKVERSAYLQVPINVLYSIYVLFAVACICRYCWLVYRALAGAKAPMTDPAKLPD